METATELSVDKEGAEQRRYYASDTLKKRNAKISKAHKKRSKDSNARDTSEAEQQMGDQSSGEVQDEPSGGELSNEEKRKDRKIASKKRKHHEDEMTCNEPVPQKKLKTELLNVARQTSRPLKGKVVAVSTQTAGSSDMHNYKTVSSLCEHAGATITGQVHKKVACVVATEEAAGWGRHLPTQRVRKAWKRQIPVVCIRWVQECIDQNQLLPFDGEYLLQEAARKTNSSSHGSKAKRDSKSYEMNATSSGMTEDGEALIERSIDLGCCCVCHDNGSIDCEWCVDCSVNRSAAIDAVSLR